MRGIMSYAPECLLIEAVGLRERIQCVLLKHNLDPVEHIECMMLLRPDSVNDTT